MDRPLGLLKLSHGAEFSRNPEVSKYLSLRRLCERYRDAGGKGWQGNASAPELDGSVEEGQMCRMRGFPNMVGHFHGDLMMAYPYAEHDTAKDMIELLIEDTTKALDTGMLWCPPTLVEYQRRDDAWYCGGMRLSDVSSQKLSLIQAHVPPPLSAYSCHAFYEAQRIPDHSPLRSIFTYDSQVTPVTGMFGTLHNNTAIDVHVDEDPDVPSLSARDFKEHFMGILCAGHTAHSQDAGVARRVTIGTDIRLLSEDTCNALRYISAYGDDAEYVGVKDWTIFCMGHLCVVTEGEAKAIWAMSRFVQHRYPLAISAYLAADCQVLVLSISSGTLIKQLPGGGYFDSNELNAKYMPEDANPPRLDIYGDDQLACCFSPYFSLIPHVRSDRPPRPLMASVQTQQAVCTPWSPGTAAVAPCYTTRPLVRTPLVDAILNSIDDSPESIADEVAGFPACMAFANFPENYEDAMLVSRRFADLGGFSSTAVCAYLLPAGEYVPPPGFTLCSRICRWWKSSCPRHCRHTKPKLGEKPRRVFGTDREPTGVVTSSHITTSGEISVRVLSFAQLQTGDKLSTGHGQKGVTNIVSTEDMPFGITATGEVIYFDIVMAISSVVNRQTNGQVYEAVSGLQAIRNGVPTVTDGTKPSIEEEVTLIDGTTGRQGITILEGKKVTVSRATWGFTQVYSQTQMVRERHHATHFVPGEKSITAPTGRSRGGGVKAGEMEFKAMISVGLVSCAKELASRGNMVSCAVCTECRRLSILCQCPNDPSVVYVTMPYGTVVFDVTSAATEGCSLEYDIVPAE